MNNDDTSKNAQIGSNVQGGGTNLTDCDISQITNTASDFFKYSKEIYSYLEDDISKGIFKEVLLQNATNCNFNGLMKYLNSNLKDKLKKFEIELENLNLDETIILYGAGISGKYILSRFANKNNILFCDRAYDSLKIIDNVKVISPKNLFENYKECKIIITSGLQSEIFSYLVENGIKEKQILVSSFVDEVEQYFDEIITFLPHEEIFVDVGCLNGETSKIFIQKCNDYKHIYMLEPDPNNISLVENNISEFKNTTIFQLGASDKKETLKFASGVSGCGTISDNGDIEINCDTLDNILNDVHATFIKMDIEGAELNALKGAQNIIKKYKPKLAISVYHKPEDIIDIPFYIKSLVPEYKFYLRHYSTTYTETVLYAVME